MTGFHKQKVFDVNCTTARKSKGKKKKRERERDGEELRKEGSFTDILVYLSKRKVKLFQ